ncbi:MAG: hypothetical protein KA817_07640 [Flavobacteriales bacterium]|nr:hypothetical protein [Flavobacteriales bacterium]
MHLLLMAWSASAWAQCSNYAISMPDGDGDMEISWSLVDQDGVIWASGGAPYDAELCLPDGCYTLLMFDSGGDGWDGLDWDIEALDDNWSDHETLNNGGQDLEQLELGEGDCNNAADCPVGQAPYFIAVSPGAQPLQVSWSLSLNGVPISSGGGGGFDTLCLAPGCLVLTMQDSGGNGWQGAMLTISDDNGDPVFAHTLALGSTGTTTISIAGGDCSDPGGGGPGGGGGDPGTGPGGGCSGAAPGGDCAIAGCACDGYTFAITPSGSGNVNEIPASGSVSNPLFFGPPWGGTAMSGCLMAGELNSTWIAFTVATAGSLQFAFGAGGQQQGFYDWAMWPLTGAATCTAIRNNIQAPVRCVWNATTLGGTGLANTPPPGGDPGNYAPALPVNAGDRFIICFSNWSFINAMVTLDFFGSADIQCGTVMPVELLWVTAKVEDAHVNVDWATGSEHNSDHFEVLRSGDGSNWEAIGMVTAAGDTWSTTEYRYIDEHPLPGLDHYRIREVDVDGSSQESDVVTVNVNHPSDVRISPQPNEGRFVVTGLEANGLTLIDGTGREVGMDIAQGPWQASISVAMEQPAPGIYFLHHSSTGRAFRVVVKRSL